MNRREHLLVACMLLGFPAAASAFQFGPPPGTFEVFDRAPWVRTWPAEPPGAVPTDYVGRAVCGEFTGDRTPDIWQHTPEDLVLFMDPSYMDHSYTLKRTTSSIARFPAVAPQTKDKLLIADASGLSLVAFNLGDPSQLATTPLSLPGTTTSWANARSISCCDLNLDGRTDFLAISAAGNKLIRLLGNSLGGYTSAPDIPLSANSSQAFALAWDAAGWPQVAVLSPTWMSVVRYDGVRSKNIAANSAFGQITKISQDPVGTQAQPDCIVWLQDVLGATGDQQLKIIDSANSQPTPIALFEMDASRIFSGDLDNDGSDDFRLITQNTQVVYTFLNQRDAEHPAVARFTIADPFMIAEDLVNGPDNTATPVLGDLNSDGKADMFAVDRNGAVVEALAILTDPVPTQEGSGGWQMVGPDSGHPAFHRADFFTAHYLDECSPYAEDGVLMLQVKDCWGVPSTPTGWVMELVMYRQEAGSVGVAPNALQHYAYDLANSIYSAPSGGAARWSFPIRINEPGSVEETLQFVQKYYIIVRVLSPDTETQPTEFVIGFTSEVPLQGATEWPSTGPMYYMTHLAGAWQVSLQYMPYADNQCPGETITPGNLEVAGAVPMMRVPRYQQGTTPNPGFVNNPPPPDPVPLPNF